MISDLISRAPQGPITSWLGSKGRRLAIAIAAGVCYVTSVIFNLMEWQSGTPWSAASQVLYNVIVITGYLLLWFLLSNLLRQRQASPLKIFWTTLLVGFLYILVAYFLVSAMGPSGVDVSSVSLGFEYGTGVPLTLATVVKMNLLSLLQAIFSFYLLLRFRDLVLYKRTRRSQRNWYLMLALMGFAAVSTIVKDPSAEEGWIQFAAAAPAIILATMNAFRVSWIVYLSFKEKAAAIGFNILLLFVLGTLLGSTETLPGLQSYLLHYSYPLEFFTRMAVGFGVLYCVTSFLFLLFHLPTTVDFQRKAGEVTAMHSLTHLVGQVFDSERLYKTIVATPVGAGSGSSAWLAVADPRSGSLRPRIVAAYNTTTEHVAGMVDLNALYDELEATREPIILDEAPADHRIHVRPGESMGSLLMAPILGRERMLGGLFVTKDVTHGFEKDDVEAISVYAAQAAIALENARLFEQQVEKERLMRELDIARAVQRKLLPQRIPTLPGTTLAASSVSALEVGGDYYDFLELDENRLAFIIADVSGKGTSAAFYMAELQGIFRSVSRLAPSPAAFLDHANTALASSLERHVFISVIYGVLDVAREELLIARGGHCPAAMINLNGDARFIRSQGLGLGLDRSGLFKQSLVEERIDLQPGDVIVLYTDGVVESRSREGHEYGYDRLLDALRENRHEDAPQLHSSLLNDLDEFLDHTEYDDDMTLVVLKWHGVPISVQGAVDEHNVARRKSVTGRVTEEIQTD